MPRPTLIALLVVTSACGSPQPASPTTAAGGFPPAPAAPEGALDAGTQQTLDRVWDALSEPDPADIEVLGRSGDVRLAWLLVDMMRVALADQQAESTRLALSELTGIDIPPVTGWVTAADHLIAWDTPAPPGYVSYKGLLYTALDDRWAPFFTEDSDIDHRLVSWGGVYIDDRPPGDASRCLGCIPALDDPSVTDASGGDWYPDDRFVFGVEIGGEARAYPRNIMEVHEMVNDSLGGRRFALPYCTLCGSAVLYFTDDLPEPFGAPTLRTTGLLSRSNKIMYDVVTSSAFDTFTGRAVSGPLWRAGIELTRGTVITTTWGDWKAAHPETTVVAFDAAGPLGYSLDPLGGRDDAGPIFPIGDRDPRLPVQEQVIGVVDPDGSAIAFPVGPAIARLQSGGVVGLGGVELRIEAGGLVAEYDGSAFPSSQSFWFAWSQFHPETLLWTP